MSAALRRARSHGFGPWRIALFLGVFAALQFGWELSRGSALEVVVVHDMTTLPAAALVRWLTPAVPARAEQFSIKAPGGGLNVRNGCEGVEAFFLLFAAFVVAPMTWRARLGGLALGLALTFALNLARIVLLFYAWRRSPALFDLLHGSIVPVAVVLLICGYFYAWLVRSQQSLASAG